jgi:hypothetical protein
LAAQVSATTPNTQLTFPSSQQNFAVNTGNEQIRKQHLLAVNLLRNTILLKPSIYLQLIA